MTPDEPSPQDAPEFDRALGVNDSVPDSEYGDQRYHPERGAVDSGQIPVGDLHEALLAGMSEDTLRRRVRELVHEILDVYPISLILSLNASTYCSRDHGTRSRFSSVCWFKRGGYHRNNAIQGHYNGNFVWAGH